MKSTIIHFILLQVLLFSFSQTKILNYSDIWNTTQVSNIYGCADSSFGESVSSAGDFNGDGIEDIIVGAINYGSSVEDLPGAAYIFYGKKGGLGPNLNLTNGLDITEGFKIVGYDHSQFGVTVSSAGDFNGDGIDDVIIGAQQQNDQDGSVYIIFGKKGGYQSDIDVSKDLDPSVGIEIDGKSGQLLGASVANLGDINGDGIDDVIFGTFNQDTFVARTYVLFGSKNISQELPIDLSTLSQTSRGFQISSNDKNKGMNDAVSSAGDMNDDGIPDILVASSNGGISTRKACGLAYVFYGRKDGKLPDIDLDQTLSPDQGFRIIGAATLSFLGNSIANLGDVNGDGIDDIVLGDSEAGHYLTKTLGQVYVIYGKKGNFDGDIDLHDFKPEQGFLITGPLKPGYLGVTVSATGDLNQDNINDFAVISSDLVNQLYTEGGNLYVIYGQKEQTRKNINLLLNLNPSDGYKITAPTEARFFGGSMASADVNDDGIPDIVVGAPATFNSTWGTDGATYVIYSQPK